MGFNAGEDGRRVFDGANPNIAARQVPLNIRFGVPGGAAGLYEPGSEGALWWSRYDDRVRGRGTASLLDRCHADTTCPRIVETFGAAEFWGLRMSPNLVGTDAAATCRCRQRCAAITSRCHPRRLLSGRLPGWWRGCPGGRPRCALAWNPNPSADTRRAVLAALAAWVSAGTPPPPSRYPTIAHGDLVAPTAAAMGWPAIPHAPAPDGKLNPFLDYDFGRASTIPTCRACSAASRRRSAAQFPRASRASMRTAMKCRSSFGAAPRAARHLYRLECPDPGLWRGRGSCGFIGAFIPFARNEAERRAAGDPRPSLEARYRDHDGFVARVRAVAAEQVRQRWLLAEDAARIVDQAERSDVLR